MAAQFATERVHSQAQLGELVEAARAGDEGAFAGLVKLLWADLVAFARSVLGRTADAEDIVQDSLVVAWQRLPALKSGTSVRSWLWKIVYRRALDHLHDHPRLEPLEAADAVAIHLVPNEIDIPRVLAPLSPTARAIVYMSLVEGWTCQEMAAALGSTAVAVRLRRMRALALLRHHLGVEKP